MARLKEVINSKGVKFDVFHNGGGGCHSAARTMLEEGFGISLKDKQLDEFKKQSGGTECEWNTNLCD